MRRLNLIFILPALLLGAAGALAQWQIQAPDYPALETFAADSNGSQLFAAPKTGLWRKAAAEPWVDLRATVVPTSAFRTYSLLAPTAALDTLYAITTTGFFSSTDCGATWTEQEAMSERHNLLIARHNHRLWFSLSGTEVTRSEDGGGTWGDGIVIMRVGGGAQLYQDPAHDNTLFVTSQYDTGLHNPEQGGLMRSDDLGLTWRPLLPLTAQFGVASAMVGQMLRVPDGTLLARVRTTGDGSLWPSGALLASTDEGETWSVRSVFTENLPYQLDLLATRVPGRLFLSAGRTSGFWRSDDNGATWAPAAGLPTLTTSSAFLYQQPQSRLLYLSSMETGLYRSTDDGGTWQPVALPPIGNTSGLMARRETLFAKTEHTLYQLSSGAPEWTRLAPLPAFSDTLTVYQEPILRRGNNVTVMIWLTGLHYVYRSNLLARSTDNGLSWSLEGSLPALINYSSPHVFEAPTQTRILITSFTGTPNRIWRSDDDGHTWIPCALMPDGGTAIGFWQDTEQIITVSYGGMADATVYRSTDEAASWQALSPPLTGGIEKVALLNGDVYVTDDRHIARCTAGVWEAPTALPTSASVYDQWLLTSIPGPDPVLLGLYRESPTLYRSRDHGATWDTLPFELPAAYPGTFYSAPICDALQERIWISTENGPAWASVESVLAGTGPVQFHPADYTILACYPNPFNSAARIRYDLLQAGRVELKLYDLQGRLVKTLVDEIVGAGRHEVRAEGAGLASGTYFVRLQTKTNTRTEKILLLK